MSARLVPLNSGLAPTIPLQRPVLLIGRHPECDIRIDLPKVSRRHCCVALAYDRVMVRDLGSRNGLYVNGFRVEEAQLQAGDEVAIGPVLYRVDGGTPPQPRIPIQAQAPPPPPPPAPEPAPAPPPQPTVANRPATPTKPPSLPDLPTDTGDDLIPIDF